MDHVWCEHCDQEYPAFSAIGMKSRLNVMID